MLQRKAGRKKSCKDPEERLEAERFIRRPSKVGCRQKDKRKESQEKAGGSFVNDKDL
jgi:hypothetical protein